MAREDELNTVHGTVHGHLAQAHTIHGGVHFHDSTQMHVVVPGAPAPSFGAGTELVVGDRTYLVQEHLVEESHSPDGAVRRQARVGFGSAFGWLRQVDDRHGTGAGRALATERDLLSDARVVQFHQDDGTTTLVTTWPRERNGRACDSLDLQLDHAGHVRGLAGLCVTLGAMHDEGVTHRGLSPAGIIVRDDGRMVLRDLGLAAHEIRVGEHPGEYQAPEQRRRGATGPGAWTDVHQVGALAHRLLTGRLPNPGTPVPVRRWEASVPEPLAAAVDAALAPDPLQRPDVRSFGDLLDIH